MTSTIGTAKKIIDDFGALDEIPELFPDTKYAFSQKKLLFKKYVIFYYE